eukprot:TRINITY_DN13112_c0_g1_i1.p1 TRINITY_DN13112_c0_g1~~TRINITY_DN13112_c0_g1_i1.p1  ORF type:complete len:235 (-),score=42.10 TRINITY_DN13112_c0_g1_i1:285-989(-)
MSPPNKVNATLWVMIAFGVAFGVLLFFLAYLIGSRPEDYGTNLNLQTAQVASATRRCNLRLNRSSASVERTVLYDDYLACSTALSEADDNLTACDREVQNREEALNAVRSVMDGDHSIDVLRALRAPGGTGAVSTIVDTVDSQREIQKKEMIRLLLKDIAEKRALRRVLKDQGCAGPTKAAPKASDETAAAAEPVVAPKAMAEPKAEGKPVGASSGSPVVSSEQPKHVVSAPGA